MKWYRLVDGWWEPYHSGYNETDLKELAYSIWSLWDWDDAWSDESFYGLTREDQIDKIYSLLKSWERDLLYIVEESGFPFPPDWEYGRDFEGHNYPTEVILKYAKTRDDLWKYDEDCLIEYVWSKDNWRLEEILDEFTYENWKDRLSDHLNNFLFDTHTEIMDEARRRFNEELWITIDEEDLVHYVSEFIDSKELYDISYDD
jgi:hypothetical protein